MTRTLLLASLLISAATAPLASANDECSSESFEQGSHYSKKIFSYKNTTTDEGGLSHVESIFTDMDGKTVVEEHGLLKGSDLVHYEIDHLQTGRKGTIDVKDGKVLFTYEHDGKKSDDSEKLRKTLVVPINFSRFVRDHWVELQAGKDVDLRYGVWDRAETVGFTLSREGEEEIQGQKLIKIKMKASSFIIAGLVKPLFLFFPADGSRLMALNGRIAPKKKVGNSWKDLDAEVLYHYPAKP